MNVQIQMMHFFHFASDEFVLFMFNEFESTSNEFLHLSMPNGISAIENFSLVISKMLSKIVSQPNHLNKYQALKSDQMH